MLDKHRSKLNKSGSGLGLSISKKIVESLEGKILVTSEEGKGTTFKFTIKWDKEIKEDNEEIKEENILQVEEVLL